MRIVAEGGELSSTVSFALADGVPLAEGQRLVKQAEAEIGMPINVRGAFSGTAAAAQQSGAQQMLLIFAALAVGRERRQVRAQPRVRIRQPIALYFDGRVQRVRRP